MRRSVPTRPTTSTRGMDRRASTAACLAASVTTAGKLALTYKGKPVSELKSGRYTITVLDETSKTGFKLQRRGKPATTLSTKPFLGRRSVTIGLARGQWMFYSTPSAKHFFVVVA